MATQAVAVTAGAMARWRRATMPSSSASAAKKAVAISAQRCHQHISHGTSPPIISKPYAPASNARLPVSTNAGPSERIADNDKTTHKQRRGSDRQRVEITIDQHLRLRAEPLQHQRHQEKPPAAAQDRGRNQHRDRQRY